MANSNKRAPFRPLGLRLLNFSRQIIQTYAASDPIARDMMQRQREETPYEPLPWAEDFPDAEDEPIEQDQGYVEQDFMPERPRQRQRRPQPQQTQPPQVSRKPQPKAPNSNLVDVGGVKVPAHVVQAFRNHQDRQAQKEQNRQNLVEDMQKGDSESIIAQRRKRGRGMQVDYVTTDTLNRDADTPSSPTSSPQSQENDSDDSDSSSAGPSGSLSPPEEAAVMRDADVHEAAEPEFEDYYDDYGDDEADFSEPDSGQDQQPASSTSQLNSVQRAPAPVDDGQQESTSQPSEPTVQHSPAEADSFIAPEQHFDAEPDATDTPATIEPPRRNVRQRVQRQEEPQEPEISDTAPDVEPESVSRNARRVQRDVSESVDNTDFEDDYDPDYEDGGYFDTVIYPEHDTGTKQPANTPSAQHVQRSPIDYGDDYDPDYEDGGYFDTTIYSEQGADADQPAAQHVQRSPVDYDDDYDPDYEDGGYYGEQGADADQPAAQHVQRSPVDYGDDYDPDYEDGGYFDTVIYPDQNGETTPAADPSPSHQVQRSEWDDEGQNDPYIDDSYDAESDIESAADSGIQRQPSASSDFNLFELEDEAPPLAKPVIKENYYDAALGTDRMKAITPQDIEAYDARQSHQQSPATEGTSIQRTPDQPAHDTSAADHQAQQPMDLHQALFEAGWVREPPPSVSNRVQRQPEQDPYYDPADFYDDEAVSETRANIDAGHDTQTGAESVQRASDHDSANIPEQGSVPAELLQMMNLPPDTPVMGLDEVFGSGRRDEKRSSQRQEAPRSEASEQPASQSAPQPTIQREPANASEQDSTTIQHSFVDDDDDDKDEDKDEKELDQEEVENIAQEVYRRLRERLRSEWEHRSRF